MTNDLARAYFRAGQFLRAQDFTDEQCYHVAMRRRHNIAHHTWGIVRGLELSIEEGSVFVMPGMAVDGYGRELIVQTKTKLPFPKAFDDKGVTLLDVGVVYQRLAGPAATDVQLACAGDGKTAPSRWMEQPAIRLEAGEVGGSNRRRPASVPDGDWGFDPTRSAPDSGEDDWPVFLGQVTYDQSTPDKLYTVDLSGRPYVGLVGEAVVAASGRAWVEVGGPLVLHPGFNRRLNEPSYDVEAEGEHKRRFAVFVAPESGVAQAPIAPALAIDDAGDIAINGNTTLRGDLTMASGAVTFEPGSVDAPLRSWAIYRAKRDTSAGPDELRVQMGQLRSAGSRIAVGVWDAETKAFKPCLAVGDDCTVTVYGDLRVDGQLRSSTAPAPVLSEQARQFMLSAFFSGTSGANLVIDPVRQTRLQETAVQAILGSMAQTTTARAASPQGVAPEAATPEAMLRELAIRLSDPALRSQFAELLKSEFADVATGLRSDLRKSPPGGAAKT